MECKAKVEEIQTALHWICQQLAQLKLEPKTVKRIELAAEEVLANIIRHSGLGKEANIEILVERNGKKGAELIFKDKGIAFNPLQAKAPDLSSGIEEREVGGLGIHLIRNLVDEIQYRRENGYNVLVLVIR